MGSPDGNELREATAAPADNQILSRLGYRPELRRTLGRFSLFAFSFSAISITASIFLNYGFGLASFGPASLWVWPVVGVGQLVIAFVLAEIATRMPLAGYSYQWTARLMGSSYSWFVAAAALLFFTVGFAAIAYLVGAPLMLSEFNVDTPSTLTLVIVSLVILAIPILINIIGVRLVAIVNNAGVVGEAVGTTLFALVLILLFVTGAKHVDHGWGILFSSQRASANAVWYSLVLSGLVGAFTLVGWESAADMGEEAVSASKRVPRAMIQGLLWAVLLGWFALIGFTLAIPSVKSVEASGQPLLAIGGFWLGSGLVKVFVAFVLIALFSLMVSGLAAEGRLLYGLARDNMLPGSRQLAKINHRSQTPIVALVVEGILIAAAIIYGALQPNAFGTLVGATSFLPFAIYALVLIAYLLRRDQLKALPGNFSLGRWGIPLGVLALAWSIAVGAGMSLPADFHGGDKVVVGGAVVAALWYAVVLYRRIRSGSAGVRRLQTLEEATSVALLSSGATEPGTPASGD